MYIYIFIYLYIYILTYVDDCSVVSHEPTIRQDKILKDVGAPNRYLGAEVGKYDFSDRTKEWFIAARLYLEQAIIEEEHKWGNISRLFPKQTLHVPVQAGSHPERVGSEFAVEMNEALRYKLQMMGIPLDGPTNCFCDNQSVVTNSIVPHSTLNKKHIFVAYHNVKAIHIAHKKGQHNLSDVLTKFLPAPSFKKGVQFILKW